MAYYSKQDIYDFMNSEKKRLNSIGLSFLNSEDEVKMNLENENNVVAVFWLETDGDKITMNGNSFFRIDHNLYTDDRFAIDSYIAMEKNIQVSDLIKSRIQDSDVLKSQKTEHLDTLHKILSKRKTNGA